ncbi:MAG: 50S ribosomal protein L3 [Dehalococcoidia bacterium]|nr:50S ribosomal protein L3 [Dehalococcoidia bacterium]
MIQGIIGRKKGMTQVFNDKGEAEAVTLIEVGPCTVVQIKTTDTDGYNAVQLGFGEAKKISSPRKGQMKNLGNFQYLREFRLDDTEGVKVGDLVDANIFNPGDKVKVTGISKGRGFAGVVKRYHFRGGPKTHGQSDRNRAGGSIGSTTTPGRVLKGRLMAGHMGHNRVTVRGLKIFKADAGRNIIMVKGAVPGADNGLVLVGKTTRGKK